MKTSCILYELSVLGTSIGIYVSSMTDVLVDYLWLFLS